VKTRKHLHAGCDLSEWKENSLWDPGSLRKVQKHPCYSKKAAHLFGRIHLPVAPKCNLECNYCIREYDCINETRPGVTSKVLAPLEALERVAEVISRVPNITVVGIAGPGEPLFNPETFETFRLVREEFPRLKKCMSSNGLLLVEKIHQITELDIQTITVTVNAVNPLIAQRIYSSVYYRGITLRGLEAARVLVEKQLSGIEVAAEKGIIIKVNTVLIPTINEDHVLEIAKKVKMLGACVLNVMPLIPQHKFAHLTPPSGGERKAIQDQCAAVIPQMRHCRQCRADAVGRLGEDSQNAALGLE